MTSIEQARPAPLAAHLAERFFAPARIAPRHRTQFLLLVAAVLALHAAGLALFLARDTAAVPEPPPEPPSVEVIQEPQPQPEAKRPDPPPAPKEEKPAEEEPPATSAPRAPPKQAAETKVSMEKTQAQPAPTPPQSGQTEAGKADEAPAAAPEAGEGQKQDDGRDAEALDKAAAQARDKAAQAARQIAALDPATNPSFAAPTAMAAFPEGQEENRYLSVVFGMVMSKRQYRGTAAARRGERGTVTISFVVDPLGNVHNPTVAQSDGTPGLEALAIAAIRAAGRLPPPPGAGPKLLYATMRFGTPEDR